MKTFLRSPLMPRLASVNLRVWFSIITVFNFLKLGLSTSTVQFRIVIFVVFQKKSIAGNLCVCVGHAILNMSLRSSLFAGLAVASATNLRVPSNLRLASNVRLCGVMPYWRVLVVF